jgi:hypothetical protein
LKIKYVRGLIERYEKEELSRTIIEDMLGIGKTRFFEIVKGYRQNKEYKIG